MDTSLAVDLARDATWLTLLISLPLMLSSLVVGLLISIGQAVTQIQEQTVSFVPKFTVELLVILLLLPWILGRLIEYSTGIFREIPGRL